MLPDINGYVNGTVPGVEACAHDHISWYLITGNGEPFNFHILHFQDTDITVPIFPAATETALMINTATGESRI